MTVRHNEKFTKLVYLFEFLVCYSFLRKFPISIFGCYSFSQKFLLSIFGRYSFSRCSVTLLLVLVTPCFQGVTKTSNRVTSNGVTGKRVSAQNSEGKFSRKRVTAKNN